MYPLNDGSPRGMLSSMKILHLAMMAGPSLFLLVILFLRYKEGEGMAEGQNEALGETLILVLAVMAVTLIPAAYYLERMQLRKIPPSAGLEKKLFDYRQILVIKLAMIEGVLMLALVVFFLTGNTLLIIPIGLLLGLLWINRPSREKLTDLFSLNQAEQESLKGS